MIYSLLESTLLEPTVSRDNKKVVTTAKPFDDINNNIEPLNNTSLDPFHEMELKTINDFEELKNILTTHHQSVNSAREQEQLNFNRFLYPATAIDNNKNFGLPKI